MRLLCFGTPDHAAEAFARLAEQHEVVGLVTAPDSAAGRGGHTRPTAPARWAASRGIPVFKPETLKDPAVPAALAALGADLGVVVAYGKLMPAAVFGAPLQGSLNLHYSLLPRWRGASPVEAALLAGEPETGVTVQRIGERLDAGDILVARATPVGADEHFPELFVRLVALGLAALEEAVAAVAAGTARFTAQDEGAVTLCGKITPGARRLDWTAPAGVVAGTVRAFAGRRTAWTEFDGRQLLVHRARAEAGTPGAAPGTVLAAGKEGLVVACGSGAVALLEVQRENKARQPYISFLNGARLRPGDRFA